MIRCSGYDLARLYILHDAATLHHDRARRLLAAHRRHRCVGLEDLQRAVAALEARRKCLDAFHSLASRLT